MPYDPCECTYAQGPLKQQLFACLDCPSPNALCYACSITCHASHSLVELFAKRNATCDCGTSKLGPRSPCFVRTPQWRKLIHDKSCLYEPDIPDSSNRYGHNFQGRFCHCDQPYSPDLDSNMLQCVLGVACNEDWYHEECIMGLRPGVTPRRPSKVPARDPESVSKDQAASINKKINDNENDRVNDNVRVGVTDADSDSEVDEDLLPVPGFPPLDSFDTLICWKCTSMLTTQITELAKILPTSQSIPFVPSDTLEERLQLLHGSSDTSKRVKRSFPFTLFLPNDFKLTLSNFISSNKPPSSLANFLHKYPFLYQEEVTYEPPEDTESCSSVYDLGLREINNLPPDQAAIGIMAMNKLQTKLKEFLTPFAQDGAVVTKDAVTDFFKDIN